MPRCRESSPRARMPIAHKSLRPWRAGRVKCGEATERSEGTLDAAEHHGLLVGGRRPRSHQLSCKRCHQLTCSRSRTAWFAARPAPHGRVAGRQERGHARRCWSRPLETTSLMPRGPCTRRQSRSAAFLSAADLFFCAHIPRLHAPASSVNSTTSPEEKTRYQ
jgi:hypothetical protein